MRKKIGAKMEVVDSKEPCCHVLAQPQPDSHRGGLLNAKFMRLALKILATAALFVGIGASAQTQATGVIAADTYGSQGVLINSLPQPLTFLPPITISTPGTLTGCSVSPQIGFFIDNVEFSLTTLTNGHSSWGSSVGLPAMATSAHPPEVTAVVEVAGVGCSNDSPITVSGFYTPGAPVVLGTITGQIASATGGPIKSGTLSFNLSQPAIISGNYSVATNQASCYTTSGRLATQPAGFAVGLPDPVVVPVVSTNTSSGTLAAGTYWVALTYWNSVLTETGFATYETIASPPVQVALVSEGSLVVNAPTLQPPSAGGYNIYIGTTSASVILQGQVDGWQQYAQSTPLGGSTTPPTQNGSVCKVAFSDQLVPSGTWYTVNLVTPSGAAVSGYPQTWCTFGGPGGTINVSTGTPTGNCGSNGVYYPTPILALPALGAMQGIIGSLDVLRGVEGQFTVSTLPIPDFIGQTVTIKDGTTGTTGCSIGSGAFLLLCQWQGSVTGWVPLGEASAGGDIAIYQHNEVEVGQQPILDFDDSGSIVWSLTNDPTNNRVKVSAGPGATASKRECEVVWGGSGTSFALTSGDDAIADQSCLNDLGSTETITSVKCRSDVASNTTTITPTFGTAGSGTAICSASLTCGSSGAYSSSCTVSNPSLLSGYNINPVMGGTLTGTSIHMVVTYTVPVL